MFEKEADKYASEYARQYLHSDGSRFTNSYCETYNAYYRGANDGYNKANEELEERIRNQAESLGVTLLEEDKKAKRIKELEKANAELKSIADFQTSSNMDRYFQLKRSKEQLAKAKEIIEELYNIIPASMSDYAKEPMEHAREFLTEE